MARQYLNNYETLLTQPVLAGDLAIEVGTPPPALAVGDFYRLTLIQRDANGIIVKLEFVDVTDVTGSILTVTRGAESTTVTTFDIGNEVQLDATASSFEFDTGPYLTEEITRYRETVAVATTAVDRAAGGIQTLTLSANSAITWTLNDGEKIQLYLTSASFNITDWGVTYWMTDVPVLAIENMIVVEKVGGALYAWDGGSR